MPELSKRDARALSDNWAGVWDWIYRHAELCEEPKDLRKLDRNADRVSELIAKLRRK